MQSYKRHRPYEERFLLFSSWIENNLIKILFITLFFLIASQIALQFELFRTLFIPVEKIEGAFQYSKLF